MERRGTRLRLVAGIAALGAWSGIAVAQQPATGTPADGHTIHVTAPHIMEDQLVDPMHHYCKVVSPEPIIECLMYASTAPDARILGIEYILGKSITRAEVPLGDWNRNWHDHEVEIEAGVVGIPDLPEEEAAKVANLVATTDGIVFITWREDDPVPTEKVWMAQAISHKVLIPAEYKEPLAGTAGGLGSRHR